MQAVTFMDQSYLRSGVGKELDYRKHIREALEELQVSQQFSKMELSRNMFQPDKSLFLEGKSRVSEGSETTIVFKPKSSRDAFTFCDSLKLLLATVWRCF